MTRRGWRSRAFGLVALGVVAIAATVVQGVAGAAGTPHADLVVTQQDDPDPVFVGEQVVYHVSLTNSGPGAATHIALFGNIETANPGADPDAGMIADADSVPAGAPNPCVHDSTTWRCSFDRLELNQSVSVDVTVTAPLSAKTIFNVANSGVDLSGGYFDPNQSNSTAIAESTSVVNSIASENSATGTNPGDGGTAGTIGDVDQTNQSLTEVTFPTDGTPRNYGINEGPPQEGVDCLVSPCHGPVTDLNISPPTTVNRPFKIEVIWDRTTRDGQTLSEITLYHDEVAVPKCQGKGTKAVPDPCWKTKKILKNGDIMFLMLSSHNGHIRK